MKKIIFKWDREWDRESVGSVFEKGKIHYSFSK